MTDRETDVLIVGGGGAGLSAALMLGDLGVDFLLLERHVGTAIGPKAHIINPRTVEAYAPFGFDHEIYASGSPHENNAKVRWITSLGGDGPIDRWNFAEHDAWGCGRLVEHYAPLSAYRHGNFQQNLLEPKVREYVDARTPGRALFHHEVLEFGQDSGGVWATVRDRDTDTTWTARAKYMIGADGGKTVGPSLGIGMGPRMPFADAINIHMRLDVSEWLQTEDSVVTLVTRPDVSGEWFTAGFLNMGPDRWDRHASEWILSIMLPPEPDGGEESGLDHDYLLKITRDMLKLPELEVEILSANRWLIESAVAERFCDGRVFLIGDAAHRHSPMGGLGLNSGIQDAHNLTWKLAHVLRGTADPALLESFDAERRPVAQRNVDFSTTAFFNHHGATSGFGLFPGAPPEFNAWVLGALASDTEEGRMRRKRLEEYFHTLRWEFECADIELGFTYADSPAVIPDGTEAPPADPTGHEYIQVARPGHRVPHALFTRDGEEVHPHGLLRPGGFLLLAGPDGQGWIDAASALSAQLGVQIEALRTGAGADLVPVDGGWAQLRGHDDAGAVLVRPDGHVAMRAASAAADPQAELDHAMSVALGGR
ncbi:unannotated protein [freshwater metagenome]|uniref:Unannotated protein n=1 Tax=freshwater metagenome TaxID=449393 RepID=A0A6J7I9K3_9ZZZZ|nr:aromatic ring hydroxylase [Actinomycetota bacterium]